MRETVKEFINRAVSDDWDIRVEANDIFPIIGKKAEIISRVDDLYILDFEVNGNEIIIRATFYAV